MLTSLSLSDIVTIIVSLIISMTVHEFMHAYVGYKLGDTTAHDQGRLSLNPLKHIDPVMTILLPVVTLVLFHVPFLAARPVPFNPGFIRYREYGAALLALAGPLSNLVLAFLATIVSHIVTSNVSINNFLDIFIGLNVIMFVFNLIPIPPLDGSRIVYAFAPESVQEFMQKIEPLGFFIIIGLVLLGGFNGILINIYNFIINLLGHV